MAVHRGPEHALGGSEPSLAYAGQHWDADAGLSYAQQRWYDPASGRFLSEDPVFGEPMRPGTLQVFGYANGNPLTFVDPNGERAATAQEVELIAFLESLIAKENKRRGLDYLMSRGRVMAANAYLAQYRQAIKDALDGEPVIWVAANPQFYDGPVKINLGVDDKTPLGIDVDVAGAWQPTGTQTDGDPVWADARMAVQDEILNRADKALPSPGAPQLAVGAQAYRNFNGRLPPGWQANHLNQDAVYGSVIPRDEGVASPMRGDAIRQPGTQHFVYHQLLEEFWDQFRPGGKRAGYRPTNEEYGRALEDALLRSGHPPDEARVLAADAARQREAVGLRETDPVPRIPARLNQVRPSAGTRINLAPGQRTEVTPRGGPTAPRSGRGSRAEVEPALVPPRVVD